MFLLAHDCCHVIADTLWKRILRKHMMEMERQKDGMVRHSVAASASEVVDSSVARSKSSVDVGRVGNAEKEVEVGGSCMSSSKGDDGTCSQKRGRAGQGGSVDGCGDGKVWNGRNEAEESDASSPCSESVSSISILPCTSCACFCKRKVLPHHCPHSCAIQTHMRRRRTQ